MENAIVVLTRVRQGHEPGHHRTSGSDAFVTHGAMQAVHTCGWHGIYLQPSLLTDSDLQDLVAQRPRGVVISDVSSQTEEALAWATALRDAGIPVVIYGGAMVLSEFDRVVSDHEDGYYQLTKWLIEHGRRRIMPMWWRQSIAGYWYLPRCGGYARAMLEAGLQPMPILDVPNLQRTAHDLHSWLQVCTDHFAAHLKTYLTRDDRIDALLMDSDGSVAAASAACRRLGCEPNRDISIAGYDNYWVDAAEFKWEPTPPAVTVDKQNLLLGGELVRLLKERMDGLLPAQPQCRVVRPQLVVPADSPG
jgi:DNA-binding LacI/PurR family transcriptional regulator